MLKFVRVYCCELSDTSNATPAALPDGDTHSIASSPKPNADSATYVAFTTQAPQLHAASHAPHAPKRHR